MSDDPGLLKVRTKGFALRIIRLFGRLDRDSASGILGRQLLRSGTSVGAQYREACRARSPAEFISKTQSAIQELDETAYWLELLGESGLVRPELLVDLRREADELLAMLTSSVKTVRARQSQ